MYVTSVIFHFTSICMSFLLYFRNIEGIVTKRPSSTLSSKRVEVQLAALGMAGLHKEEDRKYLYIQVYISLFILNLRRV